MAWHTSRFAMRIHASAAVFTSCTRRNARYQDMLSLAEAMNRFSNLIYYTHAFMAQDRTRRTSSNIPLLNMQIGSANCRFRQFNDSIRWLTDLRLRTILQPHIANSWVDECLHDGIRCQIWWIGSTNFGSKDPVPWEATDGSYCLHGGLFLLIFSWKIRSTWTLVMRGLWKGRKLRGGCEDRRSIPPRGGVAPEMRGRVCGWMAIIEGLYERTAEERVVVLEWHVDKR